jgi:hypothetical protein
MVKTMKVGEGSGSFAASRCWIPRKLTTYQVLSDQDERGVLDSRFIFQPPDGARSSTSDET